MERTRLNNLITFLKALENTIRYEFNISTFEDRLRLQKIVYIAKHFGIDLGYSYNLYLRGPYSPELARDYYTLYEQFRGELPRVPPDVLDNLVNNRNFSRFINVMSNYYSNPRMLELIATLLMLMDKYSLSPSDLTKDTKIALVNTVHAMKPYFSKQEIAKVLDITLNEIIDQM